MMLQLTGTNHQGSTLLALAGGTATAINYSPSGATRARSGALSSLPGFNGERADPFSAVTHLGNGYRAYSPALQRFTCPDSESPFGVGGINPYAYCEGDPVNLSDPSGHGPITWLIRKAVTIGIRLGLRSAAAESMSASLAALAGVETGLEVAATAATGIASKATEKTNPQASQRLKWASVGMGAVMGVYGAGKAGAHLYKGIKGLTGKVSRLGGGEELPMIELGQDSSPITNVNNYVFIFSDKYKNKRGADAYNRLNILGHGNVDSNGWGYIGNRMYGIDIKAFVEAQGIDISQYQHIRTIACYSADGMFPFAQQVADQFGIETKGFHSRVAGVPLTEIYAGEYIKKGVPAGEAGLRYAEFIAPIQGWIKKSGYLDHKENDVVTKKKVDYSPRKYSPTVQESPVTPVVTPKRKRGFLKFFSKR